MSVVGIILTVCNLFLVLIFWAMHMGVHKPKRGKMFGVNMPQERMNDDRVQEIVDWYLVRDKWWFRISLVTAFLPLYPTQYFSITHSIFLIWTTWVLVYKIGLFGKTVRKLRDLKDACGWFDPVRDADEKHWYGGIFYYNPDSKKMFTNQYMMGMGSTVNMATKGGRIFMITTAVILVVTLIPSWVLIIMDDFIQPSVKLTEQELIIKSTFSKTSARFEDIESVTWMNELKIGTKSNGSSTSLYARGTFYVGDYGKSYVFYNKAFPQLIVVTVKDARPIIFNMKTLDATEMMYRELRSRVGL